MKRKHRYNHELGSVELAQNSLIVFFLVLSFYGFQFVLDAADSRADESSNWIGKQTSICSNNTCNDFTLDINSEEFNNGRVNPYTNPNQ
jgi:hypothetical protein